MFFCLKMAHLTVNKKTMIETEILNRTRLVESTDIRVTKVTYKSKSNLNDMKPPLPSESGINRYNVIIERTISPPKTRFFPGSVLVTSTYCSDTRSKEKRQNKMGKAYINSRSPKLINPVPLMN